MWGGIVKIGGGGPDVACKHACLGVVGDGCSTSDRISQTRIVSDGGGGAGAGCTVEGGSRHCSGLRILARCWRCWTKL